MPRLLLKMTGITRDQHVYRAAEAGECAALGYYHIARDALGTRMSMEMRALVGAAVWFMYSDLVDGMPYAA
jgi:hypothetical protein